MQFPVAKIGINSEASDLITSQFDMERESALDIYLYWARNNKSRGAQKVFSN
jgi:hypothetical protein